MKKSHLIFLLRATILHTITYFVIGIAVSRIFGYSDIFRLPEISSFMREPDSIYVLLGPFFQPLRGLIIGLGLLPFKEFFLKTKGWLYIWIIFVVFGILTTPAAAPCSIEGVIYSKLPLWYHLLGFPELLVQTFLFSYLLYRWETKSAIPKKEKNIFLETLVIGCLSYIGSAVGAISSIFITGSHVNFEKASSSIKSQLLFVFAFLINLVFIYLVKSFQQKNFYLKNYRIFIIAIVVNIFSVSIYQILFFNSVNYIVIILIAIFPSIIIWGFLRKREQNIGK